MPPHKVDLRCDEVDVKIAADGEIHLLDSRISELVQDVIRVNDAVPCARLRFLQQTDPNLFRYTIDTTDNRHWEQFLLFDGPNVSMTFNVPDYWLLSEFASQRSLRDLMVNLVQTVMVTDIDVKFSP